MTGIKRGSGISDGILAEAEGERVLITVEAAGKRMLLRVTRDYAMALADELMQACAGEWTHEPEIGPDGRYKDA
jgi:hypothetical protein